jgi:uncharacterized protein (TIGR02147 family)
MIFEHNDYRGFLRAVLSDRIQRNPSYSLRSFASQVGVSPAQLSQVLRGGRHLSFQSGMKIGQRLGLESDEVEYFCLLIQHASSKLDRDKDAALQRMSAISVNRSVKSLSLDAFKMISDWYHIPILEMTALPRSQFNPRTIAKRLGISPIEAETAIERLQRLALLEKSKDGTFRKTYVDGIFESEQANAGLRQFHRKMLQLASDALETQSNTQKVVSSETFGFDPSQVEEVRKLTRKYLSKVVNLANSATRQREVYHLGVQFFRLTREGS